MCSNLTLYETKKSSKWKSRSSWLLKLNNLHTKVFTLLQTNQRGNGATWIDETVCSDADKIGSSSDHWRSLHFQSQSWPTQPKSDIFFWNLTVCWNAAPTSKAAGTKRINSLWQRQTSHFSTNNHLTMNKQKTKTKESVWDPSPR